MSPTHTTGSNRLSLPAILILLLSGSERAGAQSLTSGDRLVRGAMTGNAFQAVQSLPLPQFPNQKFCGTVQLASGFFREAYVPTAAERTGDFSAFSGLLLDISASEFAPQPFPGGIIPRSRLPASNSPPLGFFAWRIAEPAGGAGPNCLPYTGSIPFTTHYLPDSGFVAGDRQLAVSSAALTFDYTPGLSFVDTQSVDVYSTGASAPFTSSVSFDTPGADTSGSPKAAGWLTIQPPDGATPAAIRVTVNPANLLPGTYSASVFLSSGLVLISRGDLAADTSQPSFRVNLFIRAAGPSLKVLPEVRLKYDLSTQGPLPSFPVLVDTTTGASLRFTAKPIVKTPGGLDWLAVDINAAVTPKTVTLTANPAGLGAGTYLAIVRYSATTSGCIASSGPRLASAPDAVSECNAVAEAVIFEITDRQGSLRPLDTPDTLTFPPDGRTSGAFSVSAPSATGVAETSKLSAVWVTRDPSCANWLSVRPPINGFGVGETVTVNVDRGGVSGSGDSIGYIGVYGTVGGKTAGSVVKVVVAGTPANQASFDNPLMSAAKPGKEATLERVSLAASPSSPPQADAVTSQIIAHIADGAGWKTSITLVNTDLSNDQTFTLRFWPDSGASATMPVLLDGPDQLSDLALTRTIPAGGYLRLQTRGFDGGSLWQGWAELISSGSVSGTAIFRKHVGLNQDAEGSTLIKPPTLGRVLLPFDNTKPFSTTVALVNPSATQSTTVQAVFRDQFGTLLAAPATFTLDPRSHGTYVLREVFPNVAGKRGVAEFTAACGAIAGLGLRFHEAQNAFTSVETIDPDFGGVVTAIPHIVAGSGWETSIILVNTDYQSPARFTMRFWPGKDTPSDQAPAVEGHPRRELVITDTVPIGGSLAVEVRGAGGGVIWQGWAELSLTSGTIAGLEVFRKQVLNGDYSEAASPLTALRNTRFLALFDNLPNSSTTLAVVNPNALQGNSLGVSLRDELGHSLAPAKSIALQVRGYDVFPFVERFPSVPSAGGVAEFNSTGAPILGVALRLSPQFALTSIPLVPK